MASKGKERRYTVLHREALDEARELVREAEYHDPKCARMNGDIYCNCGARPVDQVFKAAAEVN